MRIQPHSVQGNFFDSVLTHFEAIEGYVARVYTDKYGIPTVGIGYAILTKTLTKNPDGTDHYDFAADWKQRLQSVGIIPSTADELLLRAVRDALNDTNVSVPTRIGPGETGKVDH